MEDIEQTKLISKIPFCAGDSFLICYQITIRRWSWSHAPAT